MNNITLISIIKYNNYELLSKNINKINSNNYIKLLATSFEYHSKECFDILTNHTLSKEWLNQINRNNIKLLPSMFEMYIFGPNIQNEYYLDKILSSLALFTHHSIKILVSDLQLFQKVFMKIDKCELFFRVSFYFCSKYNKFDIFKFLIEYLRNNNQYSFLNNEWVQRFILFYCLIYDCIDILRELDILGYNISSCIKDDKKVESIIVSLYRVTNKFTYDTKCFDYLISKNITTNKNLLCAYIIDNCLFEDMIEPYDYYSKELFKLENDFNFNYNNIEFPSIENYNVSNDDILNNETLITHIQNGYVIFNTRTLNMLIDKLDNPLIKQLTQNIFNIENIDIFREIAVSILKSINTQKLYINNLRSNKYKKLVVNFYKMEILNLMKICKYVKENNLSNYNPLDIQIFECKKNKKLCKNIIKYLIKLSYELPNEIKKLYFTKNEIKNLDKIIKAETINDLLKNIKNDFKKKKPSKQNNQSTPNISLDEEQDENEIIV
jgi:hypothetical protein